MAYKALGRSIANYAAPVWSINASESDIGKIRLTRVLHTSFVNTAIDNMKDNRVLNNRPLSINDEETQLLLRQRTTLSQLHSRHCKLLNSYKKQLKRRDSSSCPDCGMDPQDVHHIFDCTAHANDMSPVNLWDMPVETIPELSFLDPGNLD